MYLIKAQKEKPILSQNMYYSIADYMLYEQLTRYLLSNNPNKEAQFKAMLNHLKESDFDGGNKVEKILFGRVIKDFSVNEILFLLCKKSYNDDFRKFRQK